LAWYEKYKELFWQERFGMVGFREFPPNVKNTDWLVDVDSGPIVNGFGAAATAFSIGAARANNHFDDAYAVSSEVIALSWPLLDGTLLGARVLSNFTEAPYLGEAAVLFLMTRQPKLEATYSEDKKMPIGVLVFVAMYFLLGVLYIVVTIRTLREWVNNYKNITIKNPKGQLLLWMILLFSGLYIVFFYNFLLGFLIIIIGGIFPRGKKRKKPQTFGLGVN